MSENLKTIPDLVLERYLLGEMSREELRGMEEQVNRDPELAARLETLKESNQEILKEIPPVDMAAAIGRKVHMEQVRDNAERSHGARLSRWSVQRLVPAAGLAAVVILSLVFYPRLVSETGTSAGTRIKGSPELQVFLKKQEKPVRLGEGDTVREGDVLQLRYVGKGTTFGAIFSLDGNGEITMHFPEQGGAAGPIEPRGAVSLRHSYELDNAPGFERFIFLASEKPFGLDDVIKAARSAEDKELKTLLNKKWKLQYDMITLRKN